MKIKTKTHVIWYCTILCALAIGSVFADDTTEKRIRLDVDGKKISDVLAELADHTGLKLVTKIRPAGTFGKIEGLDREQTPSEIIARINDSWKSGTGWFELVRKDDQLIFQLAQKKTLNVNTKVINAKTKEPVKNVAVYEGGFPENDDAKPATWRDEKQSLPEGNGVVSVTFERGQSLMIPLRFDAEGYASKTEIHGLRGGIVECTIELESRPRLPVRIVSPDGKPASNAEMFLYPAAGHAGNLDLTPDSSFAAFGRAWTSDAEGNCTITETESDYYLIARHAQGVAVVSSEALRSEKNVSLLPWVRIEGTIKEGNRIVADTLVMLSTDVCETVSNFENLTEKRLPIQFQQETKTDDRGNFVIEKTFPNGKGDEFFPDAYSRVQYCRETDLFGMKFPCPVKTTVLRTKAGKTDVIEIGGQSVTVTGRIAQGERSKGKTIRYHVELFRCIGDSTECVPAGARLPKNVLDQLGGRSWFYEGSTFYKPPPNFDGKFQFEGIEPGRYRIQVNYTGGKSSPEAIVLPQIIVVPENNPSIQNDMFDIGTVEF